MVTEEVKVVPRRVAAAPKFKIFINNDYIRPLLEKVVEATPEWTLVTAQNQATLSWYRPQEDFTKIIEWLDSGPNKMCNRYPDIRPLCHKDLFGRIMK